MDKFHEPQMVAIAPPTYVLRVWIEACTYAWIRNIGDNVYQMMLRYKRWTFEALYQSECTIIPSLAPRLALNHLETYFEKISLVKTYLKKKVV